MEGGRKERKRVGVWEWKRGREGRRDRGDYGRWGKRHKRVPVRGNRKRKGRERRREETRGEGKYFTQKTLMTNTHDWLQGRG